MIEFLKFLYFKLFNKGLFKVTNGFSNIGGEGMILTGYLLSGEIEVGCCLIFNSEIKIAIIEIDRTLENSKNRALIIPREFENSNILKLYKLYGQTLRVDKSEN